MESRQKNIWKSIQKSRWRAKIIKITGNWLIDNCKRKIYLKSVYLYSRTFLMKNAQSNFEWVSVFNVHQMASRWQYRDDKNGHMTIRIFEKCRFTWVIYQKDDEHANHNIFVVSLQTNDWQVINKIKNLFVREYERKAKYMVGSKIKQNGSLFIKF